MTLKFEIQATTSQSELARGPRDVAAVPAQRSGNHSSLNLRKRIRQRPSGALHIRGRYRRNGRCGRRRGWGRGAFQLRRELFGRDYRAIFSTRHSTLNLVTKLSHVSWPVADHQQVDGLWRDLNVFAAKLRRVMID